jgi:hypothetical protein
MADKKFTLLELNLGDGTIQVGPATLGGDDGGLGLGQDDDGDEADPDLDLADDADAGDGGSCPGRTAGKLILALLAVAVVTLLAKKLLGGGDDLDELEALADLDEDDGEE